MAQRFEFRLDAVLRLRQLAVDRQRRALAEAIRDEAAAVGRVQALDSQWFGAVQDARGVRTSAHLDVQSLRQHQLHHLRLQRTISAARDELGRQQEVLAAERERLANATRNLRVMEKLRERQWLRFRREQDRAEQALSDEAATQQYVRSSLAKTRTGG